MLKNIEKFERVINIALLLMLALVVLLATIDLGWIIVRDILTPPVILLEIEELLELFGAFLLVMIGVELLNTVKTCHYLCADRGLLLRQAGCTKKHQRLT